MSRRRALAPALWALAAGLVTFLALESALARRVGLDLLLPAEAGAFLPGRLARLCACLVACFALALTDRGRSFGRALDRFCERDRGRWAASAAVTALFFAWAMRVIVLSYMTNDDPFFLQFIARIPQEGMAMAERTFSHPYLCWFLGKLYGLWPNGYWYLGYHLAVLLASAAVIGRCVLCRTSSRGWPVWAGCAVHGLLCAGIFLCCFSAVSFTVTPAVAGSAAVALVLCRDANRTTAGKLASDAGAAVLMCLCILQRQQTGQALLCFWALACAYQLARSLLTRQGAAQTILFGAVSLATAALVLGVDSAQPIDTDWDYRAAESARSMVVDFLNDDITLDQYERAGIPQELAVLVHGWFFMDQRVTTELFDQLIGMYYADQQSPPAPPVEAEAPPDAETSAEAEALPDGEAPAEAETLPGAEASAEAEAPADTEAPAGEGLPAMLYRLRLLLAQLADYLREDAQMLWRSVTALALLAVCAAALVRSGRRCLPELLCALCAVGGALILLLYLVQTGRFLLRVFLVVALPATVMLLLLALCPAPEREAVSAGKRRYAALPGVLCAGAAAVCCLACVYTTPNAAQAVTRADLFGDQWAVEAYARANPDTTLITSMYEDYFDPLHTPADYPANRVLWGACGDTAKSPEERLYADALFRDDVLFMTDNMGITLYLLQYLTLDWGPVQAVVYDRIGTDVYICRLEQIVPSPDYTGWYEQNGLTYYFQDGQALTGGQTIDGESYTFAPIGAQSQMAVTSGSALIYSTDAYSLVEPETETP